MFFDLYFLWLFFGFVAIVSVIVGWAANWDRGPGRPKGTLDPDRIQRELLEDETLSEEERAWLKEMAALELPRRHLIC